MGFSASNPEIVENAIKYIIFLTNVNQLYDVALGMYDFKLVLMIAQYSQKVRLADFNTRRGLDRFPPFTGSQGVSTVLARATRARQTLPKIPYR